MDKFLETHKLPKFSQEERDKLSSPKEVIDAKSIQLCLTLCDPMDCSLPGSDISGILQARILEWVTMPSSRKRY